MSNQLGLGLYYRDPDYLAAEQILGELLKVAPNVIATLRAQEPAFTRFTPDLILTHCLQCRPDVAEYLCPPFSKLASLGSPQRPNRP